MMRPLSIVTVIVAAVAIIAGLGLQQAQATVLLSEDFGADPAVPHGTAVTDLALGWVVHEGGMLYSVTSAMIDVGNAVQGSSLTDNDAKVAIPGGPYTLGANEFFRLSYVSRPAGGRPTYVFVTDLAVPTTSIPGDYMQLAMNTDNNNQAYTWWNDAAGGGSNEGGLAAGNLTATSHVRVEFDGSGHRLLSSLDGRTWTPHGYYTLGGMSTANTVIISSPGDASYMDSIVLELISGDIGAPEWIPGDATGDGSVDEADAQKLAANWQTTVATDARGLGNFNGDTIVDDLDATILAANWGAGGATAVPEPGVLILFLGAILTLSFARARTRNSEDASA